MEHIRYQHLHAARESHWEGDELSRADKLEELGHYFAIMLEGDVHFPQKLNTTIAPNALLLKNSLLLVCDEIFEVLWAHICQQTCIHSNASDSSTPPVFLAFMANDITASAEANLVKALQSDLSGTVSH